MERSARTEPRRTLPSSVLHVLRIVCTTNPSSFRWNTHKYHIKSYSRVRGFRRGMGMHVWRLYCSVHSVTSMDGLSHAIAAWNRLATAKPYAIRSRGAREDTSWQVCRIGEGRELDNVVRTDGRQGPSAVEIRCPSGTLCLLYRA